MCESRAVPSGEVYRQLFDAQVQLSRSLLVGRKDTRTDCVSAEDSNTHSSSSSRRQQVDDDDDDDDDVVADVSRLPDCVVVDCPSSDIIERLSKKRSQKHQKALKQLDIHLSDVSQVCETQVRTISQQLLSSLQEVNLRLDTLKVKMERLEDESLEEVCVLWQQVEEEVMLKKVRISELNLRLSECERGRVDQIRGVLKRFCLLLETISFLPPPDIHRLLHAEATMLNQSLLANRRSTARLLLLLQEENLQQGVLLRRHWEGGLRRWRRSRVRQVVEQFRSLCSSEDDNDDQRLTSDQKMKQTQRNLAERRRDIICEISCLVPPTCSPVLVSDWFDQLTAVNQEIDSLHTDYLQQLRCRYEQSWRDQLSQVERCKEALSALQLSDEEAKDVVSSQLLPLIGQRQAQDEDRLAALDMCGDSAARHALSLSRCVFVVMRAAALLWETHCHRLERTEEDAERRLDDLRRSQQEYIQRKRTPETSLDAPVCSLHDVRHRQCVSDQCEVLDCLPSLLVEELLSYSRSLAYFFHLSDAYTPSPEELQILCPFSRSLNPEANEAAETPQPEEKHPISNQADSDPAQDAQDWLTEAESALLELCDISSCDTFASSRGVVYSGPAFRCSTPDLLQQETHLSLFPVDVLTHSLSRSRSLFLDHLEQHFHNVLASTVAVVTDRKEAVRLAQEVQLRQLNSRHINTHTYLAELQQRVDGHGQHVLDVLTSCRAELQQLHTSVSQKNQEFSATLSNMEDNVQAATSSRSLEAVSSALQDLQDQHIKDTRHSQNSLRQTVEVRLQEVRNRTTHLLSSFSELPADFSPQEVKVFQRRLKEETRRISVTEEVIFSELEASESRSSQQVREVSDRLEEKIGFLMLELKFTEKIQKIMSSTQFEIKAQAAVSNHQQSVISSRLEDLRMMMDNTQVSPDQVFFLLSSLKEELRKRCDFLDFNLDSALLKSLAVSSHPELRRRVQPVPPSGLLQSSRTGVDHLKDLVVGVTRSLTRFSLVQDSAAGADQRGRTVAGQSPVQRQQRRTESISAVGGRKGFSSSRRFQMFGPKPEAEVNPHSFSSTLNSVLWKTNNVLLLDAEEFYRSKQLSRFQLLPDSLDQWAESMQQRLLGYQEQAMRFLSTSREEVVRQLSVLDKLLTSLPSVLIGNHERQHEAGLREEVGGVRQKLEESVAASERLKDVNVRRLRVSLSEDELQMLNSREELRQQRLQEVVCCTHLELQRCVQVRGEEFVTSLAALTEKLLHHLGQLTPAETDTARTHQPYDNRTVVMETAAETGSSTADPLAFVTMATTASNITARCNIRDQEVIKQRDAAVQRLEQLVRLESSRSDDDKRRRLSEQHSWNTHWRQEIYTLKHIHTQ